MAITSTISNRDLSWLAFNERVLQEAQDKSVPLVQRLRFLGIFSNNLDEFIKVRIANMVRFARLKEQQPARFSGGYLAKDLLPVANEKVTEARQKFSAAYHSIRQEMEQHNIFLLNEKQLNEEQKVFCREYFSNVVSPHLVPLMLRKSTQIPFLNDNKIYLAIRMSMEKKAVPGMRFCRYLLPAARPVSLYYHRQKTVKRSSLLMILSGFAWMRPSLCLTMKRSRHIHLKLCGMPCSPLTRIYPKV